MYSFESNGSAFIPMSDSSETTVHFRYEAKLSLSCITAKDGLSKDDIIFMDTPAEDPGV